MTPDQIRLRMRSMLDDAPDPKVVGQFWSDRDLNRTLDTSQLEALKLCYEMKGAYEKSCRDRIRDLLDTFSVTITGDEERASLPANYLYPVGATINGNTAQVQMLREAVVYEQHEHYGALIEGDAASGSATIVFKGSSGGTGILIYYRRPIGFNLNPTLPRTEFDEIVYEAIFYHAICTLALKDGGNSRWEKHLSRVVQTFAGRTGNMLVRYAEEVM